LVSGSDGEPDGEANSCPDSISAVVADAGSAASMAAETGSEHPLRARAARNPNTNKHVFLLIFIHNSCGKNEVTPTDIPLLVLIPNIEKPNTKQKGRGIYSIIIQKIKKTKVFLKKNDKSAGCGTHPIRHANR
jgi:hypothetical protein